MEDSTRLGMTIGVPIRTSQSRKFLSPSMSKKEDSVVFGIRRSQRVAQNTSSVFQEEEANGK